jgi:hypothetical protein
MGHNSRPRRSSWLARKLVSTWVSTRRLLPFLIAVCALAIVAALWTSRAPSFVDLKNLEFGNLNEAQQETIKIVTELNKFLISLVTLIFTALGFYLTRYRKDVYVLWSGSALFIALVLLGATYVLGFMVYSTLTGELAQNALGLDPGYSRTLYYLEMEFSTTVSASIVMLFIFVASIWQEKRK